MGFEAMKFNTVLVCVADLDILLAGHFPTTSNFVV